MSTPTCPICANAAKPPAENAAFPFCSPRCKVVDLGRWFSGTYRIPGEALEEGADQVPEGEGSEILH